MPMSTPISIRLAVGSKEHKRVLDGLKMRYRMSSLDMARQHKKWRDVEKVFQSYIPEREKDAERRLEREQEGKVHYTTVVVPYSYALLMSAHTYWTSVFLSRNPIFQYMPRHAETRESSQAVEAVIDYQVLTGGLLPTLYLWLLDVGKFGVGVLVNDWREEDVQVSSIEDVDEEVVPGSGIFTGRKVRRKVTRRMPGYQGNGLMNVRPSNFFPDTRQPLHMFQKGEFCGHVVRMGWNEVLEREADGEFFNVDSLRAQGRRGSGTRTATDIDSPKTEYPQDTVAEGHEGPGAIPDVGTRNLVRMVVKLQPRVWGLGESEGFEKWVFTATEEMDLIVGAHPQGLFHDKFPYVMLEYEPDAYTLFSRGMLELLKPLQDVGDWLLNSHMYAVRKLLNGMVVVDQSRIRVSDILDPEIGGVVRYRPSAYGTNVNDAVHQLTFLDPTGNHISEVRNVFDIMQRVVGVNDAVQGQVQTGGRQTATAFRGSTTFSINRLKTNSEFYSAMGWQDLAQMMLQNTQQHFEGSRWFRVAGDLRGSAGSRQISPEDIFGFYDYVPVDGTMPVDRFAMANLWREMLVELAKFPQVLAGYDVDGIIAWVAQLAGLKNIRQFKLQTAPDDVVDRERASGNLVGLSRPAPAQVGVGPDGLGPPPLEVLGAR